MNEFDPTIIAVTGGGQTTGQAQAPIEVTQAEEIPVFDPDHWVTSFFRTLKAYVEGTLDPDIYDIVFSFPSADDVGEWPNLVKTIVHFEVDDINNPKFGFGDNIVDTEYDDVDETIIQHEAQVHIINMDVGVWASKQTGGVTARLEAYQRLVDLFNGPSAFNKLREFGIEIISFAGANFIKEEIDDVSVFRVMDMVLQLRVYSRKVVDPIPYIAQINQASQTQTPDGQTLDRKT